VGNQLTSLEVDTLSRKRIVSEMDANFFVEAGAGSGKTTMLVSRMVAMVESGIDISKICAITFTRAAAGEFYDRFQKLLIARSNPDEKWTDGEGLLPKPTTETRARCAEALQHIDLCFMGTIDAFCSMVLSEHPSEARIPSDATTVTDLDAAAVYKQLYVKISEGEYGSELASLAKTFNSLHRGAEEIFIQGISLLMDNRNVRFHFSERADVDIDRDFADDRETLVRAVKCLSEHPELKYDREKKSAEAWGRLGDVYKSIRGKWSSNFPNLLFGLKTLGNIRLIPEAMDRYAPSLAEMFEPGGKQGKWLEFTGGTEEGVYGKLLKLQYDVSMTFLSRCVSVIEQVMREKGSLTFFDYLYYLRNMLMRDAAEDGKLIRYISNRHSYYLIDEFQDTNPMQAEVFFYLSALKPVPQWSACVPREGSLFIVGDPKQSIYRFRSADVTSFLKVKRLFEANGGAILSLSRNFRSSRVLCEYYNRVFQELLPSETDNQSKFEEIPLPDTDNEGFGGVYTYRAYAGKASEDNPDKTDPVRIADMIELLVGREDCKIIEKASGKARPITYNDFMVITYGKKNLSPIMAELDVRGIPMKVEGDVPFEANEALYEIHRIYACVADAGDKLALYRALTGKLLAHTKEDVMCYKANGGELTLYADFDGDSCGVEAAKQVAKSLEKLKMLEASARRLSPAALFSKIMDDFRIYQIVEPENLEVVYYSLELLRSAEKAGTVVSAKDGSRYIAELISGTSGEERCLSLNDRKDCVHMANLHKVKGLEAPIVILAASANITISATTRVIHGDDGSDGYVFSVNGERDDKGRSRTFFATAAYAAEQEEENEALKAEGNRLVYVAATRAKNALILCDRMTVRRGSEVHDSKWALLQESDTPDLFEVIKATTEKREQASSYAEVSALYEAAAKDCVLNDRSSETASFAVENPSHYHATSKLADAQADPLMDDDAAKELAADTDDGSGKRRETAAILGTMVHKLMEMMVTARNRLDVEPAILEILREYRTPTTAMYEDEITESLRKVAIRMRSGGYEQANGVPKDILTTLLTADEVFCEVPFCYKDEADGLPTIWNGVMDVVYVENGIWHIIDYKTNADGTDLDMKYQSQMTAYEKALKSITGHTAKAQTYHIDI